MTFSVVNAVFGHALLAHSAQAAEDFDDGAEGFQVVLGGELQFGVTAAEDDILSDGDGDRGFQFFMDSEIYIEAELYPSDDLTIGGEVLLDTDTDDETNANETYIFASGALGLMRLGRTGGAEDDMALGADTIAAGTGGIDGDTENLGDTQITTSGDAAKISYYTPRIAGFQFGASFTPDTGDNEGGGNDVDEDEELEDLLDHVGTGLNFVGSFGDVDVALGVVGSFGNSELPGRDDLSAFSAGGTLAFGAVEMGASYGENRGADEFDFATLGATVGFGEARVGIGYNYLDEKADGITQVVAVSGDVVMLPGVELQGDVSYADLEDEKSNISSVLAVSLAF